MADILNETFDWSPLGEAWWRSQADLARASDLQLRFACSFVKCGNATEAARQAGYASDDEGLRQAGYGARHSRAVETLLTSVSQADGGPVTRLEMRRLYERMLRTGSGSDKIRAGELLLRLDDLDAQERERADTQFDPKWTVREISKIDALIGSLLAKRFGLRVDEGPPGEAV